MNLFLAASIALLYWFSVSRLLYNAFSIFRYPLVMAPIMGLLFNNMSDALVIGATLQMIYIGSIAPGGNPPADEGLASCVAMPIALATGMTAEIAITIAIPLGVLGVGFENLRKTMNTTFIHMADKYALEGNVKGVQRCATIYPLLAAFPLRFIPVFVALLLGPSAVEGFINSLPTWALNGLSVAGGILPALGFAITIIVIGKKEYLPLFVIGFFAVAYLGLSTIAIAIFGVSAIAFTYMTSTSKKGENSL